MTLRIFFLSFQTRKGITAVDLLEFAKNVTKLATQFETYGNNQSGPAQTKAYVSKGVPLLSILPFIASGQEKSESECPGQVNFVAGQVKIGIWWPSGQVK